FENPGNLLEGPGVLAQVRALFARGGARGIAAFNQLSESMKLGLTQGIHNVFLVCLGVTLVALVIVWFLKELPLRGRKDQLPGKKEPAQSEVEQAGLALP